MTLKVTILGCASSGGVPRVGRLWGACDPGNPKNRRRRCAILVQKSNGTDEKAATNVLIDTPPDLREQLLDADVGSVDGVLFTHDHADHTHGIDDLRVIALQNRQRVPVHVTDETFDILVRRFGYCFTTPPGSDYPSILDRLEMRDQKMVSIEGQGGVIQVLPFAQLHGNIQSMGFRIGNFAYSTDLHDFPETSLEVLKGLDIWVLDALRYTTHPSHLNVEQALAWIERMKPRRAILTNLHVDLDYETLKRELPANVEPAYDGMQFSIV